MKASEWIRKQAEALLPTLEQEARAELYLSPKDELPAEIEVALRVQSQVFATWRFLDAAGLEAPEP